MSFREKYLNSDEIITELHGQELLNYLEIVTVTKLVITIFSQNIYQLTN
jgi:hypothetical protein